MVIGVITGRGAIPLFRVPSQVKINAQYYVDYVLKPVRRERLERAIAKLRSLHTAEPARLEPVAAPVPPVDEPRAQRQVPESSRHSLGCLSNDAYAFTIHAIWEVAREKRTQVSFS